MGLCLIEQGFVYCVLQRVGLRSVRRSRWEE